MSPLGNTTPRELGQRMEAACRARPWPTLGLSFGAGLALGLSPLASAYLLRTLGGVALSFISKFGRDTLTASPPYDAARTNWN